MSAELRLWSPANGSPVESESIIHLFDTSCRNNKNKHSDGVSHQLIRFTRVYSNVSDFSCRKKALTAKLLKQGYRYHKLRKAFLSFIADTVSWLKNMMLASGNVCNKLYQVGWGLMLCLWPGPPWFN